MNIKMRTFAMAGVFVWMSIIVLSGIGWNPLHAPWDFSNTGAFGDSFGPLGAIMAGLAALAAFEALKEQRREISRIAARERAEDQRRAELDERDERQRRLRQTSESKQVFERTFFSLLEALRHIVQETDVGIGDNRKTSRDAFKAIVNQLVMAFKQSQDLTSAWQSVIERNKNDLNHYFRFLYHIIHFVHLQEFIDRYFYIRLVRASLSESEMILMFANCAVGDGSEKFKPLVEQYVLLHNISPASKKSWKMDEYFFGSAFEYGEF